MIFSLQPTRISVHKFTKALSLSCHDRLCRRLFLFICIANINFSESAWTQNTGLANSPWPSFRFDAGHTAHADTAGPDDPVVYWEKQIGVGNNLSPVITPAGLVVFTSADDTRIYALGPKASVGRGFSDNDVFDSSPVVGSDGTIYIGSTNRALLAINPDFTLKWREPVGGEIEYPPVLDALGNIYVVAGDNQLYAFHPDSLARKRWSRNLDNEKPSGPPAIGQPNLIYVAAGKHLYAYNASGSPLFKAFDFAIDEIAWVIAANGRIYAGSKNAPMIASFNGTTGSRIDILDYSAYDPQASHPCTPAIGGRGELIFTDSKFNRMIAVELDLKMKWDRRFGNKHFESMPVTDATGQIYIVSNDEDHGLFSISAADGKIKWRLPEIRCTANSGCGPPCSYSIAFGRDGTLYIPNRNVMYAVRERPRAYDFELFSEDSLFFCLDSTLSAYVRVLVRDQYGDPFPRHRVVFHNVVENRDYGDSTDAQGLAEYHWMLPKRAGEQKIHVRSFDRHGRSLPSLNTTFVATVRAPQIAGPGRLDFDSVEVRRDSTISFPIYNQGKCPLLISRASINGSNNFTLLTAIENSVIVPGNSVELQVRFSPTIEHTHSAVLQVENSDPDPEDSLFDVELHGVGIAPNIAARPDPVNFFEVCLNTSNTLDTLTVTNTGLATLHVTELLFSDPAFTSPIKEFTLNSGESRRIPITFKPTRENYESHLTIVSNALNAERLPVDLIGRGAAGSLAGAQELIFDPTAIHKISSKMTTLYAGKLCETYIDRVTFTGSNSNEFRCSDCDFPKSIREKDSLIVTVEFQPDGDGARAATMQIWSTAQNQNSFFIPLHGVGVSKPDVQTEPDSLLRFVAMPCLGDTAYASIKIINTGSAVLTVSDFLIRTDITPSAKAFLAPKAMFTVQPQDTAEVRIGFVPQRRGLHSSRLEIVNTAANVSLDLEGYGIPDTSPPLRPEMLQASPSGWSRDNTFTLTWENPPDTCGVVWAYYKLGAPPTNNDDTTGSAEVSEPPELKIKASKPGTDSVYVWLADGWGNSSFENHAHAIIKFDNRGPSLIHQPPEVARVDSAIEVFAVATDDLSGLDSSSFQLHFTRGGKSLDPAVLLKIPFRNDIAVIPADLVTPYGVEYSIVARDSAGNPAQLPEKRFYSIPIELPANHIHTTHFGGTRAENYQLRSVPLALYDTTAKNIFLRNSVNIYDPTAARLWDIHPQRRQEIAPFREFVEFGEFTDLTPDRAVLLIAEKKFRFHNGPGRTVLTNEPFKIPVIPGWNLIASPFYFEIPSENLTPNSVLACLYYFAGSWRCAKDNPSLKLRPWEGYAVKIDEQGPDTLYLDPAEEVIPPSEGVAPHGQPDWSVQISAYAGSNQDLNNFIGIAADAAIGLDPYERIEPPHHAGDIALYFPHYRWKTRPDIYATDFRPATARGHEWNFEIRTGLDQAGEQVTVRFDDLAAIPSQWQILLHDLVLDHPVALRNTPDYRFRASRDGEPYGFRLLIGDSGFVTAKLPNAFMVPTTIELQQNFPNPFNPATTIRFGLPQAERVSLVIYGLKGEVVRVLLNHEEKSAGYHLLVWDGRNQSGERVASGVYIYRLQAGAGFLTRKFALIK